ncbi:Excinuclease ABC, C subunit-like protein (fragment) [uncultured Sphingopyxis sp.]|uniref:Excinuclease ABC, C subunit-like protein n=1 Tax=uncultured Sphingopyxis sp. TaxID=310581 RepID=A0A1Y5PW98_9SPHN
MRLKYPFASSEVEMPIGLVAMPMGVSTSLDTNGTWEMAEGDR